MVLDDGRLHASEITSHLSRGRAYYQSGQYSKQKMTGLEGNRQICLPREILPQGFILT